MLSRKITRIVHNISSKKIPKRIKRSKAWQYYATYQNYVVLRINVSSHP
jgi:hypothetical protein